MVVKDSLILQLIIGLCVGQNLILLSPSDFVETFRDNKIKVTSSPIGYKPKFGSLHGKINLASPLSACTQIEPVSEDDQQEDIFVMADDKLCLQSVKAANIGASGAYAGIIKRNLNNTLHDREINVAHIPILQIDPNDYDRIISYMSQNPGVSISVIADFSPEKPNKKINLEVWMSPNQVEAYQYIMELEKFILNQLDNIQFHPRFALHSQTSRKQYIGCYSSGRFCPSELEFQGKPQGSKIMGESLRQIIIASKSVNNWFTYASYYYLKCLNKNLETLWQQQNIQMCSQSSMLSAGIKAYQIASQFNKSFQGPRPEVDSNFYLEQERQLYLEEKITQFPVILLNGKQYELGDPLDLKLRICSIIHPDPTQQTQQCQKITNPPLFTSAEIMVGCGLLLAFLVLVMLACRQVIYKRMKKEMKGEVDKTLSQYYKYMEALEQPDPSVGRVPLVEPKYETTQIGSVQLSEIKPSK